MWNWREQELVGGENRKGERRVWGAGKVRCVWACDPVGLWPEVKPEWQVVGRF